jgi:hypothetical protein
VKAIVSTYRRWNAATRRWRAWLHEHAWYAAILLVLCIGLVEPLGCVLQCQLWLHTGADGAQHAHHHISPAALAEPRGNGSAQRDGATLAAADLCSGQAALCDPSDAPEQPVPALAHEHLGSIIVPVLLALILLAQYAIAIPPHVPPQWAFHPRLRPPIRLIFSH